jgi:hypothetical protein
MNSIKLFFFVLFICFEAPVIAQNQTYEEIAGTIPDWVETRVKNAQNGIKEKIEMPFVVRTLGWGCMCPDNYIGISPNVQDGPWIAPKAAKNFPVSDTIGYSLIVTGYFTGKYIVEDLRNKDKEPEDYLYKMPEFKILTWRENTLGYDSPPPKIIE